MAPMFIFDHFETKGHEVKLVLPEPGQATELFAAVERDRDNLQKWMPWTGETKTAESEKRFLKYIQAQMVDNKVFMLTVVVDGHAMGMIDFHKIDHANHHAEVGYWLSSTVQGNGIMTMALKRLIKHGFGEMALHKILVLVDTENERSRAIPERLNFVEEGVLKDDIWFNGAYRDFVSYVLINNQ